MTTWVNINRNVIVRNAKRKTSDPPIRVAQGKRGKPTYAHEVEIMGPSRLVYDADKPVLPCGARLAIATEAEVKIVR
jgi:hypothetical protein